MSETEGTATSEGRKIFYTVTDLTPPWQEPRGTIVFHHGIAANADMYAGWLGSLADAFRLVRIDMYGCRNSPAPDSPDYGAAWTVDARVADLLAVVGAAALGPVHLVGESYGGTVCLTAALGHPGRFASVTCTNTAHVGASVRNVSEWQAILDEGGVEGWSDYIMDARFAPDALSDPQRDWFSAQQRTHGENAILHVLRSLLEVDLLPRLASLGIPALLMNGDQSPFVAVEVMEEMRDAMPDAHLRIFPGVRHGLPFSHAPDCAAELRRFLDERF